jgi:hypothetical protein
MAKPKAKKTRAVVNINSHGSRWILSIDPHMRSMAWAVIDYDTGAPVKSGTNKLPASYSIPELCKEWGRWYYDHFTTLERVTVQLVVVEIPDHVRRGINATSIIKQSISVGALLVSFDRRCIEVVMPREWKGRAKKDATDAEAERVLHALSSNIVMTQHETDAYMMGRWAIANFVFEEK